MNAFPIAVFALCFLTSVVCLILLTQAFRRTRNRLLLWSALCFVFLALNNGLVMLDMLVLHDIDLRLYRHLAALSAVSILLYGFIWDVD